VPMILATRIRSPLKSARDGLSAPPMFGVSKGPGTTSYSPGLRFHSALSSPNRALSWPMKWACGRPQKA
jgi:hypothetical protein